MNLPFLMRFQFVNVCDRRPEDMGVFDGKRLFSSLFDLRLGAKALDAARWT